MGSSLCCCKKATPKIEISPDIKGNTTNCCDEIECDSTCCIIQVINPNAASKRRLPSVKGAVTTATVTIPPTASTPTPTP